MHTRFTGLLAALAVLVPLVAAASYSSSAHACSCMRHTSPAKFVSKAGAIFEAVVSKIEVIYRRDANGQIFWPNQAIRSTVHVTRVYKGFAPRVLVLHSHVGSSLCGWQPTGVGRRQLIVAHVHNGRYSANSCTMSALYGRSSTNRFVRYIRSLPSRKPR